MSIDSLSAWKPSVMRLLLVRLLVAIGDVLVFPDVGRSYTEPQKRNQASMARMIYNPLFKTRIVQWGADEWGVEVILRGWFKRWEVLPTFDVTEIEDRILIQVLALKFRSIYNAHALRNTIATEELFHEYVARETLRVQREIQLILGVEPAPCEVSSDTSEDEIQRSS